MENSHTLTFSRSEEKIFLRNNREGTRIFSYPAHNRAENLHGNPLQVGSQAPAPEGILTISIPDFINEEFRENFYREHNINLPINPEEAKVCQWGEFEESEMGRVRFALGNEESPEGTPERSAWDRELLVHGGSQFDTPTKGCIRMDDKDLEKLAADWIRCYRKGIVLRQLTINP